MLAPVFEKGYPSWEAVNRDSNKMNTLTIPYNKDVKDTLGWKAFKVDIEEKHGHSGTKGRIGEEHAMKHLQILRAKTCFDHSYCALSQWTGVDITAIYDNKSETIDVKHGSSFLYYHKEGRYWYIKVWEDSFNPRKINTHLMHISTKGDLYVKYNKDRMKQYIDNRQITSTDGYYFIPVRDITNIIDTNL